MARLDVRIRGSWPGQLEGENGFFAVTVCNVSLGGALLKGNLPPGEFGLLHFSDERGRRLSLRVRFLRREGGEGAVSFVFRDVNELVGLWSMIRDGLPEKGFESCPYCNTSLPTVLLLRCPNCKLLLCFNQQDYLQRHIQDTLWERLKRRFKDLNGDFCLQLLPYVDRALEHKGEKEDEEFVGTCEAMLKVFSLIRKVAPTDVPVLILGETGTGKELTARAIHERSPRRDKPFVVINCAAIPENLLEAELFGYERGAFTGAYTARKGKVEQAHGGTLFLDEIGELPLALQAKLLRFLEDGSIERIGSRTTRRVDTRIIAATNRNLEEEVEEGRFREDLYYRLSVVTVELPPLRERGKDKVILATYFLKKLQEDQPGPKKRFSKEALEAIMQYHWPGNVREMINKIRKALLISESEVIRPEDLSIQAPEAPKRPSGIKEIRQRIEKESLLQALKASNYNITRTAKILGVSRPTVYNLMRRYRIQSKD